MELELFLDINHMKYIPYSVEKYGVASFEEYQNVQL